MFIHFACIHYKSRSEIVSSWWVGEADCFTKTNNLPSDRFEKYQMFRIMFPDLRVDQVIHWLQISGVCNTRYQKSRVLINVPTPRLVHNLITEDVVVFPKDLSNFP